MSIIIVIFLCVIVGRFAYLEHKLYKLRIEYVQIRVDKLKTEYKMRQELENECMDEDYLLLKCQCDRCEFGDSTSIGFVCCLDKAQFTENGNCSDFIEK